jgi:hypothetical protein
MSLIHSVFGGDDHTAFPSSSPSHSPSANFLASDPSTHSSVIRLQSGSNTTNSTSSFTYNPLTVLTPPQPTADALAQQLQFGFYGTGGVFQPGGLLTSDRNSNLGVSAPSNLIMSAGTNSRVFINSDTQVHFIFKLVSNSLTCNTPFGCRSMAPLCSMAT